MSVGGNQRYYCGECSHISQHQSAGGLREHCADIHVRLYVIQASRTDHFAEGTFLDHMIDRPICINI